MCIAAVLSGAVRVRMCPAAVLMDQSGLTKRQSGIVVINRPEHQLPMFVLTIDNPQAGPAGVDPTHSTSPLTAWDPTTPHLTPWRPT